VSGSNEIFHLFLTGVRLYHTNPEVVINTTVRDCAADLAARSRDDRSIGHDAAALLTSAGLTV
jgi:hypothetical protein